MTKTKHVHPVERRLDWVHEFKETLSREYEIKDPEGYSKVTESLEKVEWPWLCFEYGEDCYNDPIPAAKEFYEDVAKKGMNVQEKYTRKTPEQAKLEEARIAARDEARTKSEKQKNTGTK